MATMVDVVAPQPGQAICDPASGTGGEHLGESAFDTFKNAGDLVRYIFRDKKFIGPIAPCRTKSELMCIRTDLRA